MRLAKSKKKFQVCTESERCISKPREFRSASFIYCTSVLAEWRFSYGKPSALIRLVPAPLVVPAGQRVAAAWHSLAAAGDADGDAVVLVGPGGSGRGEGGGGGGEGGVAPGAHRRGAALGHGEQNTD